MSLYFLEKESRTKDLLFQSVLSYAKINEVREILNDGTFLKELYSIFHKSRTLSHKGDRPCQNQSRLMPEVQV